jgi:hypothetical protein
VLGESPIAILTVRSLPTRVTSPALKGKYGFEVVLWVMMTILIHIGNAFEWPRACVRRIRASKAGYLVIAWSVFLSFGDGSATGGGHRGKSSVRHQLSCRDGRTENGDAHIGDGTEHWARHLRINWKSKASNMNGNDSA